MRSMSSSTGITGGVVPAISSHFVFLCRGPIVCLGNHKPGPDTTRHVLELSGRKGTPPGVPGQVACGCQQRCDHPTMKSRSGSAKSVDTKYLFCGVENC